MSTTNGVNSNEDADLNECDGEKVVTMMDVLKEQEEFEEDANAVLGASDDKNCTYSKGYIKRQAIYACLTCCPEARNDPLKRAGVCLACSLACHESHELVELYTKRNFRCDCGNSKFNSHPCQFTPNKTELNEDNHYNQNFSGLYCTCHRPYPDPENPIDDEMIQCIICEDWLHSAHLEATVPTNEYAEMICKGCMDKNEFIHDYSDFAVDNELAEIDVTLNGSASNSSLKADGPLETTETKDVMENEEEMETDTLDKEKIEDVLPENKSCVDEGKVDENLDSTNISNDIMDTDKNDGDLSLHTKDSKELEKTNTELESNDIEIGSELKSNESNCEREQISSSNMNKDMEIETCNKPDELPEKSEFKSIEEKNNDKMLTENIQSSTTLNNDVDMTNDHEEHNSQNEHTIESSNIASGSNDNKDSDKNITNVEISDSHNETTELKSNDINNENEQNSSSDINEDSEENILSKEPVEILSIAFENESDKSPESVTKPDASNISTECENNKEPKISDTNNENDYASSSNIDKDIEVESSESKLEKSSEQSELNSEKTATSEDKVTISPVGSTTPENETEAKSVEKESASLDTAQKDTESVPVTNDISQSDETLDKNIQETKDSDDPPNVTENKRKLSTEEFEEEITTKKAKLDECKQCVRPKGIKRRFKGATFWPSNFRQKLCTCNECISMYKDLSILFLIDPEDTVTAYETLGKEKINGTAASQYEKGLEALSSLDRIQQINALTEYNKMRDKLLDFLKSFKDRKEVVKEEDIKAFFAGMKPKREPDGVYFCR